jgi:uncharacterized protein YdhG (YjbR/CyaY superfamily)
VFYFVAWYIDCKRLDKRDGFMWKCPRCKRDFKKENQDHYCGAAHAGIDEYIAAQAEEVRPVLNKIRKTIQKAAPRAIEKIACRMPTFWLGENLIHFAAFKKHIGIYPGDLSRIPFEKQLSAYQTSRGAIQFPLDKPIDLDLIADITRFRVSAVTGKELRTKLPRT